MNIHQRINLRSHLKAPKHRRSWAMRHLTATEMTASHHTIRTREKTLPDLIAYLEKLA